MKASRLSSLRTTVGVLVRSVLRNLGLTNCVRRVMQFVGLEQPTEYEKPVQDAVRDEVRLGDVAWDVGANRGVYTAILSELVGPTGKVFAIEPEATNVEILRGTAWPNANVAVLQMALSNFDGEGSLRVASGDQSGRTHRLAAADATQADMQSVPVKSGGGIVVAGISPIPAFIKMDVEGAEVDALEGCRSLMQGEGLRAVLVELHFGLLASRGDPFAPARIEAMFREHGFATRWLDRSHLLARRE